MIWPREGRLKIVAAYFSLRLRATGPLSASLKTSVVSTGPSTPNTYSVVSTGPFGPKTRKKLFGGFE